jgi:tartrate dehydratase alpha subunit/fumarate hydratase class I-like protein
MLKNANIAAGWILPMCQDTGTAIVMGKKGHQVWTDGDDEELGGEVIEIDLNRPMDAIRAELSTHPVSTRLSLSGPIIVARDIAHAKLKERLDQMPITVW